MTITKMTKPEQHITELFDFEIIKLLIEFGYTKEESDKFMLKIMKNRTSEDKAQVVTVKLNDPVLDDSVRVRDYDDVYYDLEEELYLMRKGD